MESKELYQTHTEHLKAIYEEKFSYINLNGISPFIIQVLGNSERIASFKYKGKIIYVLLYEDSYIHCIIILSYDIKAEKYEIVSCYPCFSYSSHYLLKINRVEEWNNKLEATIYASTEDGFEITFFASDYYSNKSLYKVGDVLSISLASLGMEIDGIDSPIRLEYEKYVRNLLNGIGKDVEEEDNLSATMGNCEYEDNSEDEDNSNSNNQYGINFNVDYHPYFFVDNYRCPDEGNFMSPAYWLFDTTFYENSFVCARIYLEDDNKELSIPLYFNKKLFEHKELESVISGHIWIVGKVDTELLESGKKENNIKAEAYNLKHFLISRLSNGPVCLNEKKEANCLNDILVYFPYMEIREGYVLDAYSGGGNIGSEYFPYCHPIEDDPYPKKTLEQKTPILDYFRIAFNEYGILEAWFIEHLSDFMPKRWHAQYNKVNYIFSRRDYLCICENDKIPSPIQNKLKEIELDALLPKIKMGINSALMSYSFWTDWGGLIKQSVVVERKGESVSFSEPETTNLVKYNCMICF